MLKLQTTKALRILFGDVDVYKIDNMCSNKLQMFD